MRCRGPVCFAEAAAGSRSPTLLCDATPPTCSLSCICPPRQTYGLCRVQVCMLLMSTWGNRGAVARSRCARSLTDTHAGLGLSLLGAALQRSSGKSKPCHTYHLFADCRSAHVLVVRARHHPLLHRRQTFNRLHPHSIRDTHVTLLQARVSSPLHSQQT